MVVYLVVITVVGGTAVALGPRLGTEVRSLAHVLAGGEIAGVAGTFLSVPVIAAIRIVWRRLQEPDDVPVTDAPVESSPAVP